MFSKIHQWLAANLHSGASSCDEQALHLAAAILLLEVSRADFDISDQEQQAIIEILIQQFSLSADGAQDVLRYAMKEHEEYTSAHPFIRMLNEELDSKAKLELLAGLWKVAFIDHKLDKYEEYHVRKIADWLYLAHTDFIRVKHKVMDELGISQ